MFERLFGGASNIPAVSPREAWGRLTNGLSGDGQSAPVLLDVREPWEYNSGHAKGATNLPLSQLGKRLGEVPRNRPVLLICQSGHRSVNAAKVLQQQGITQVVNVSGGTTAWRMHGLPVEGGKR